VDNIKMDLRDMGLCFMDRTDMTQDMNNCGVFVNATMNLQLPK
jgi:hypothetical protein